MTSYRRFIGSMPPHPAALAPLIVPTIRRKANSRQEAALVDWEEEGGRLAVPGVGAKPS